MSEEPNPTFAWKLSGEQGKKLFTVIPKLIGIAVIKGMSIQLHKNGRSRQLYLSRNEREDNDRSKTDHLFSSLTPDVRSDFKLFERNFLHQFGGGSQPTTRSALENSEHLLRCGRGTLFLS